MKLNETYCGDCLELMKEIDDNSINLIVTSPHPFSGSGTTAVASKQLKRRFIGIDISKEYVDIANKRLAQQILT